jgi:hypothetical protein
MFLMDISKFSEQISSTMAENEILRESYAAMASALLSLDDDGWRDISTSVTEDGFALIDIKRAAKKIRETSEGNPLLKRGAGLRTSYIFGRGIHFNQQPPRIKRLMETMQNQDVLFSPEAQVINERSHFTDGQFFVLGNVETKSFQRIPFDEISGVVTNPDDNEEIWYYRRTWTRKVHDLNNVTNNESKILNVWYPADTYGATRFASRIQNQPVDPSFRMFASRVNRRAGKIWGVPDAFPALPWAHAYNEYLKDGSRMLKALSMFAWQLKSKTRAGASNAAAAIANPTVAGSTAVLGQDMELSSMPRSGGGIDLTDGRPLGSMVASALEVSVVALLSDPGTSGAYGTAQTLDVPTIKAMEARQHVWTMFYKRIMDFMGAREVEINWPKIETEPSQRLMQALALAKETNAIWEDEYREAVIETLDIPRLHDSSPSMTPAVPANNGSAVPSQGNSGSVGSMQDNANDLRDQDANPTA